VAPTDGAGYVVGRYVALALRVDAARLPPRILEMQVKQATKELLEQTGRTRLSSAQRTELKERVKESLRQRVFPSIQVFDLIWNTALGTVYFCSHGVKPRNYLEEHFKKSFGLALVPLIGYLRAEEILQESASKRMLEDLRSSSMVP
jgi:DNA recombination-dependent growth factor C